MVNKFESGCIYQLPLPRHGDLLQEIEAKVRSLFVNAGTLQFIGAVYEARVGYFDVESNEYVITEVDEFAEIASGMGTISEKDGETAVHVHVVLAGKSGRIYAGHLMPGSRIFVTELTIHEFDGPPQERRRDPETGLYIWQ
ncbi:MAG: DUF296 domain-containing protein [Firmicutes bacterium]|nr:DUF296 domain-containing protein [Bacillota bacterium]